MFQKTFNCNTSFDESNFIESGVLVIELENPGNHTNFDFSLFIQDGEIRQGMETISADIYSTDNLQFGPPWIIIDGILHL